MQFSADATDKKFDLTEAFLRAIRRWEEIEWREHYRRAVRVR